MKSLGRSTLALLLIVPGLLGGCVAPLPVKYGLAAMPVEGRLTEQLSFAGVTFHAPRGDNWIAFPLPCRAEPVASFFGVFAKRLHPEKPVPSNPYSMLTEARAVFAVAGLLDVGDRKFDGASDFQRSVEESLATQSPSLRLIKAESFVKSAGPICVEYRQTVERSGASQSPASTTIQDMHGITCVHPVWPRYVADFFEVQRYPKGAQPLDLGEELKPFFDMRLDTYPNPGSLFCLERPGDWSSLSVR